MKYVIVILLLLVGVSAFAQKADSKSLAKAVADFDKALINKDSVALNHLLNNDLQYGHSNGWIETKRDVIADLFNGKLIYKTIVPQSPEIKMEGKTAAVRTTSDIDVLLDGKPMAFKLKVLQVWVWKNKHWELFARQSVKI